MSFYQQNRMVNAKRPSNSINDGIKSKNPRWSKPGREDVGCDRSIDSDQSPYQSGRSSRNHDNNNEFGFDNQRFGREDRHQNAAGSNFSRNRPSPISSKKSQPTMGQRNFVEPQHAGPAWNWDKYFNECSNWHDKHKLAYYKSRCLALEFENQMLLEQVKTLIHENGSLAAEYGELPTMLLPNFPGGLKGFVEQGCVEPTDNENKEKVVDKEKEAVDKNGENKKKDGPKAPRGLKREEELTQLFGEAAEMIQNLETSIQHSFNRFCDTLKPEMYPVVALNPQTIG